MSDTTPNTKTYDLRGRTSKKLRFEFDEVTIVLNKPKVKDIDRIIEMQDELNKAGATLGETVYKMLKPLSADLKKSDITDKLDSDEVALLMQEVNKALTGEVDEDLAKKK